MRHTGTPVRRCAGAAILNGTLPFEAGVPTTSARLAGVPVVVAQGEHDTVIQRELLDRTWTYLLGEPRATISRRAPVGHGISAEALAMLGGSLQERLSFLAHRGRPKRPEHVDGATGSPPLRGPTFGHRGRPPCLPGSPWAAGSGPRKGLSDRSQELRRQPPTP